MSTALTQRLNELPNLRQVWTLLALAGAVAAGLWLFSWSQRPGHAPLYPGLTAQDAAEVVEALKAQRIEHRIDFATGAVTVPAERLHEARMKLAAQGLPQGGNRLGFEMISGEQGFGVSQFVEGARYQHALETELARTIATLRPVRDARVHLALPKPSAFARQRAGAGASVVLDLFPGRGLDKNQVAAIVRMVSASVADLAPEAVAVIDQGGRLLTEAEPDSDAALSAAQFDQVRRVETSLVQRIHGLLEPMTGPGRVSAEVSVDLDFSVSEEAREVFAADPSKVRSEQTSEQASSAGAGAVGVPGAVSNTPPGPAAATAAEAEANLISRNATRNFELDRTVSHVRQPGGRPKRITVAVLVDHLPRPDGTEQPLSAEELARVEALVREAVGFDAGRGDSVAVMNAPFVRVEPGPGPEPPPLWENPVVRDALRLVLGAIAVLALLFGVLRPLLRQLLSPPPPRRVDIEDLSEAERPALTGGEPSEPSPNGYEQRLQVARGAVAQDPKRVAQVVKSWVGGDA